MIYENKQSQQQSVTTTVVSSKGMNNVCPYRSKEMKDDKKRNNSACPYKSNSLKSNKTVPSVSINSNHAAVVPQLSGSRPIVGHLPLLKGIMKETNGEMTPALCAAFNKREEGTDIVGLDVPGLSDADFYVTNNADYAAIVSTDLEHWGKITHKDKRGGYYTARKIVGNALFTASDGADWAKSHRILMPAFSPSSLSSLVDITLSKTNKLLDRIESYNGKPIEIGKTFTSLTFDIIGNFTGGPGLDFQTTEYPERMATHPFLVAMDTALTTRHVVNNIDGGRFTDRKTYHARTDATHTLWTYAMDVINDRISGRTTSTGGPESSDVLDLMLTTIDKETNEKMDIEMVRNHLILFLLVGHDSTSSLLTSLMYVLSQNPEVENKMRAEVDRVLGGDVPTMQTIKKLPYMMAVIKETLRLYPPAGVLAKNALKDTTLGPFKIKEGSRLLLVTRELHRNKDLWGSDADEFDPERFMPNSPKAPTHDHAWMPFSSGTRGCIGMQFSLIEARVIAARIMQRRITFRLHKDAEVKEKFRIFMKLSNVMVTAHKINKGDDTMRSIPSPILAAPSTNPTPVQKLTAATKAKNSPHDGKIRVYYGSNMGTCEDLGSSLCDEATNMGFDASLNSLDDAVQNGGLARDECLNLIVTSTYNGQPPDNAKRFAEYMKSLEPNSLKGVKVAILGVGNSNWKSFQAFSILVEDSLRSAGADILCKRGIADEEIDLNADVDAWRGIEFWPSAFEAVGLDSENIISSSDNDTETPELMVTDYSSTTDQGTAAAASLLPLRASDNQLATVISARELQDPGSKRSTRHVELKLPNGMDYCEGDHLAVFPENNPELVLRVAFLLNENDLGRTVMIASADDSHNDKNKAPRGLRHLPLGVPVKVAYLLSRHVDLQAPVSAAFVVAAAKSANDSKDSEVLLEIAEFMADGVTGNWEQLRPAQILSAFPSVQMSLGRFLATVAPMKKRYYSISSSPKSSLGPQIATITVGLVEGKETAVESSAFTNPGLETFHGVSSGFLADVRPGQLVEINIGRNDRFRLPKNPSTPAIMIGPGTGVAPFRGFIQALGAEKTNNQQRPAMLFFGCRNEKDYLYRSELESAPLELSVAFSRPTKATPHSQKQYVQDLLWLRRERVWKLLEDGAHIYVCGDGRYMAKDVDNTLHRIAVECGKMNEADAIAYYEKLQRNDGYLQDVWC